MSGLDSKVDIEMEKKEFATAEYFNSMIANQYKDSMWMLKK